MPDATVTAQHPLAPILRDAAQGAWPAPDGAWELLPAWRHGVSAIVALTGRAYVCSDRDLSAAELTALGCDGFGGATLPAVVQHVAGPDAWIDCLDVLLIGRGRGAGGRLVPRAELADEPRARNARRSRSTPEVLGYAEASRRDLVTVATGLAGLREIGVEAAEPGRGATLFADALDALPAGEPVVAGVAPGNARSLRSALRAGFAIIGSVQIIVHPATGPGAS